MTEPVLVNHGGGTDRRRLLVLVAVAAILAVALLLVPRLLAGDDDAGIDFPASPVPTSTTVAPPLDSPIAPAGADTGRNPFVRS